MSQECYIELVAIISVPDNTLFEELNQVYSFLIVNEDEETIEIKTKNQASLDYEVSLNFYGLTLKSVGYEYGSNAVYADLRMQGDNLEAYIKNICAKFSKQFECNYEISIQAEYY